MSTNYLKLGALVGAISLAACADVGDLDEETSSKADDLGEEAELGKRFTRYVALGDSYVSGDGVWDYAWGDACHRSPNAWPILLKTQLETQGSPLTFQHAACSGATIDTVRVDQLFKIQPADANTLITVTVGGNDLNIVKEMTNCIFGRESCASAKNEADLTKRIDASATPLESLFKEIKLRASKGTVIATGYPLLVTADAYAQTWCKGLDMQEALMVRKLIKRMNQTIAGAAQRAGIASITTELEAAFDTHEACAADSEQRWINGGNLGDAFRTASVLHPNLAGNQAFAATVKAALDQGVVTTVSNVVDVPPEPLDPGFNPTGVVPETDNPPSDVPPAVDGESGYGADDPYGSGSGDPYGGEYGGGDPYGGENGGGDPYGGGEYGGGEYGGGEPYGEGDPYQQPDAYDEGSEGYEPSWP